MGRETWSGPARAVRARPPVAGPELMGRRAPTCARRPLGRRVSA